MEQGLSEHRRISIRSVKLCSKPRSIANEIIIEYQVQRPIKQYVGMSTNKEHQFKTTIGIEYEGSITMPINPDEDADIMNSLFALKSICENKISKIFGVPLDVNHPDYIGEKRET